MTKQEMLDYLVSTGLFDKGTKKYPYAGLFYEERMIDAAKTVPISELVERFIEVDKAYNGRPWNLLQILTNINMIIPAEDREEENNQTKTKWIKFEDELPQEGQKICILLYEDWSRNSEGHRYQEEPEEFWRVCSGYYSKHSWYISCKKGIKGGVDSMESDFVEGQFVCAVAWYPMPEKEEIR